MFPVPLSSPLSFSIARFSSSPSSPTHLPPPLSPSSFLSSRPIPHLPPFVLLRCLSASHSRLLLAQLLHQPSSFIPPLRLVPLLHHLSPLFLSQQLQLS